MNLAILQLMLLLYSCSPTAAGKTSTSSRTKRDGEIEAAVDISITLTIYEPPVQCYGENTGLSNVGVRLEYRADSTEPRWTKTPDDVPYYEKVNYSLPFSSSECVEYRLVQYEHGGGSCNCWNISHLEIDSNTRDLDQ